MSFDIRYSGPYSPVEPDPKAKPPPWMNTKMGKPVSAPSARPVS